MSSWAVSIYRLAAKVMGIALHRHEIVESVYANRGVGRGEIAFGRSDIDLSMIVSDPDPDSGDAFELFSLYRRVRALRRINPALSHMMIHDRRGFEKWMRTDSYMGSQERRSMLLLAGKPAQTSVVPVRREDAIRWMSFYCDRFLPVAIQKHNRRNLRKMALESWKAWSVARGMVAESYLTLREAERNARLHPIGTALSAAASEPGRITGFIMNLAGMLHDELLPPLHKLRETKVIRMLLPPKSRWRILVILPHPGAGLPEAAYKNQSLVVTPEFLHLYVHYFNPFLDWFLPPELKRLGFIAPTPDRFVHACHLFGQGNTFRLPGFVRSDTWLPHAILAFNQHSIPFLCNGETPPPMSEESLRAALEHNSTFSEYYLRDFATLHRRSLEHIKILERLDTLGGRPQ